MTLPRLSEWRSSAIARRRGARRSSAQAAGGALVWKGGRGADATIGGKGRGWLARPVRLGGSSRTGAGRAELAAIAMLAQMAQPSWSEA